MERDQGHHEPQRTGLDGRLGACAWRRFLKTHHPCRSELARDSDTKLDIDVDSPSVIASKLAPTMGVIKNNPDQPDLEDATHT
ncbi:hypothetical protein EMIT048CA2_150112 [Pseudomonas chlororaphis]